MLKSRVAFAALAAALLSIFAAPAANAAYAPPPFTADAPNNVAPGGAFSVTFDAGNVTCDWALVPFQGQNAPGGHGSTYTVNLTAPTTPGTYTVTANCTWDPNPPIAGPADTTSNLVTPAIYTASAATVSSDTLLAAPQTDPYSVQIVVGTPGNNNGGAASASGALPDTGGSNFGLLAAGAGLLVVGAGVTIAARRRKSA